MSTSPVVLRRHVLADLIPGSVARNALLVVGGAAVTGLAAQLSVSIEPLSPVPVTGQTFAVLLVAAALGPWRALASMALYLAVGMAGVPWFAGGTSGAGGASFGYILGYLAAGLLVGELARRAGDRTPLRTVGTMLLGNAVIYAFGVSWLVGVVGMAVPAALVAGVLPFLLGDAIKVALAAGVLPGTWALVRRFGK
ncbi:biotin biosynthesis protein BioY [Actinocatenispora thailandica]|uniref:Biotin transporter n=1 Tax=Actinocatenispora thailandica TaxID=227318 RepID=A0A7R7HW95_9ACTN|nr:biotin transporter BioY [Actinocatenispora thailandica]BCJ34653.1 biotin biosynthesis protein BioY [Actinocatenispora thailandica]